jgi:hypothetical protein
MIETPAWSFWMLRLIAGAAGVLLLRNAVHGLRSRPLGLPRGRTADGGAQIVSGWLARFWGLLALACALLLLSFAVAVERF